MAAHCFWTSLSLILYLPSSCPPSLPLARSPLAMARSNSASLSLTASTSPSSTQTASQEQITVGPPAAPASLGPPVVKQALVHAASYITTESAGRVLKVDMRPLLIHLLAGLESAGLQRAVVTLGAHAAELAECVSAYGFRMHVDFVWLTLGTAGAAWHNLANSILAARTAFRDTRKPLLIVRADQLYDW